MQSSRKELFLLIPTGVWCQSARRIRICSPKHVAKRLGNGNMPATEKYDRDSTLFVGRGLYILRYEKGGAGRDAPIAFVSAAADCEDLLDILCIPGTPQ